MTPSLSDYTNGAQTSSLVLESVSSQDYGDYVCTAENTLGQVGLYKYV